VTTSAREFVNVDLREAIDEGCPCNYHLDVARKNAKIFVTSERAAKLGYVNGPAMIQYCVKSFKETVAKSSI
jgi:hypothetical protein